MEKLEIVNVRLQKARGHSKKKKSSKNIGKNFFEIKNRCRTESLFQTLFYNIGKGNERTQSKEEKENER